MAVGAYAVTKDVALALTLLVIACPGALVISTPISVIAGIGRAARGGILIKGGEHLEAAGRIRAIAFDKTGTLTEGRPEVLTITPLAGIPALPAMPDEVMPGTRLLHWAALDEIRKRGETVAAVAVNGSLVGLLGFADRLRPEAAAALQHLREIGVKRLVMLTGDHEASAQRIAREIGIDEVHASLLPEQKLLAIQAIQRETGPTAMVGDGINDAPALATADIGIAMGVAGTDVAIESADIALMADDLGKIAEAIGLARATLNNIRQNVAIALLTVFGLLAGVLANEAHMAGGMFIHQVSVLVVVLNGMRLMRARPARKRHAAPATQRLARAT